MEIVLFLDQFLTGVRYGARWGILTERYWVSVSVLLRVFCILIQTRLTIDERRCEIDLLNQLNDGLRMEAWFYPE